MKILLIDDHISTHEGFRVAAENRLKCSLSTADNAEDAKHFLQTENFDIVVTDVVIGNEDALDLLCGSTARVPFATIIFTATMNPTFIARGHAVGVDTFLFKSEPIDHLFNAIKAMSDQRRAEVAEPVREVHALLSDDYDATCAPFALTNRECQVLRHLGLGLSNREIASSLSISVETVKEHVQNILRKIEASDRTDAAVKAVRAGLLPLRGD